MAIQYVLKDINVVRSMENGYVVLVMGRPSLVLDKNKDHLVWPVKIAVRVSHVQPLHNVMQAANVILSRENVPQLLSYLKALNVMIIMV